MSATGLCKPCWETNLSENITQLAHHQGPRFELWRQRMAASVGGVLLDDPTKAG